MLEEPWRITLCGTLMAQQGTCVVTRFRTQKTGLLLAYLAYYHDRTHGREVVAELFWPDSDKPSQSLRTALGSLRQQLEPPGVAAGTVLIANRAYIRFAPETIHTDIADFDAALAQAAQSIAPEDKVDFLTQGVELIKGELLPGYYEDWVQQARQLLAERLRTALQTLITLLSTLKATDRALIYAVRLLHLDTLNEAAHLQVMRLLIALERPADAQEQFIQLTTMLRSEFDTEPSPEACALAESAGLKAAAGPNSSPNAVRNSSRRNASVKYAHIVRTAPDTTKTTARLPLPLTTFFGREQERDDIARLLSPQNPILRVDAEYHTSQTAPVRLLTLLGTGGVGKTRLAIEAGRDLCNKFGQAVCFVSLVEADTSERILEMILEALRQPLQSNLALIEQVSTAIGSAPFLLILDNLEQITEIGAKVIDTLLQTLPGLTVLVTSRKRLDTNGEHELLVMPLPTPQFSSSPEGLLEFAGIQLFVDKARAARADFQLTPRNAAAVTALCHRLDGLPLALELAAGWSQTLTPAQILERLNQRFALLKTRRKGIAVRHQALQTCIEWSFRLLPSDVQDFFCSLSVFRGGWSLEAAEAVCDEEALEKLQQLRDASFLQIEEIQSGETTEMRYRLLETLREFGQEQLDPVQHSHLSRRYAHYFLEYAESVSREMKGSEQVVWLDRAEREHDNFRQSLRWCETQPEEAMTQLSMAGALWRFWSVRGFVREGREQLTRALDRLENKGVSAERVRALNSAGVLAWHQGDFNTAEKNYYEAVAMARLRGDKQALAECLGNLGNVALFKEDFKTAQDYYQQCHSLFVELNNLQGAAMCLINLGLLASSLSDKELARSLYLEAYTVCQGLGDTRHAAFALCNCAYIMSDLGDFAGAWEQFLQCLPIYRDLKDWSGLALVLGGMATTCGDLLRTACLYGASEALRELTGEPYHGDSAERKDVLARLDRKEVAEAWARGKRMNAEQMIEYAQEEHPVRPTATRQFSIQAESK